MRYKLNKLPQTASWHNSRKSNVQKRGEQHERWQHLYFLCLIFHLLKAEELFQLKLLHWRSNWKVLSSSHCSPNTLKFFPLEKNTQGGRHSTACDRIKLQTCLCWLTTHICFENGVLFFAWWFLRIFPELTLDPLKSPQHKDVCIPQVLVRISESRAPSPVNPAKNSQLTRCTSHTLVWMSRWELS